MKLPIDVEKITTFTEAKNAIEKLLQAHSLLQKENGKLREEIARLKGQPKKPSFSSTSLKQQSSSITTFLHEKRKWHKGSKGKLPIDRKERLPEVTHCVCGSNDFRVLRTHTKIMQGMLFTRNNVAYHGREKQCVKCGKHYKSIVPQELQRVSFDNNLRSLLSFFKYGCRMTHPLIYRMLQGFGIQISYGEIGKILLQNSRKLQPTQEHLRTVGYQKSSHLQSDATGVKRKEKTGTIRNQYMQLICNRLLSVFSITKYYNAKTLNRLLGKAGRKKPFVSDDGSPNGESLWVKIKQLCFVHEIRRNRPRVSEEMKKY